MIQGNYDNKTAYVHNTILWGKLFAAGWPVTKRDLTAADDVAVEVIKSTEDMGYWCYWVWAPTSSGHRVLVKLMEFDLFPSAIDASLDQLQQQKHQQLLRFARCYHHKKQGLFQRLKNLLAKKHQASALISLPARPENNTQGAAQTLRALPFTRRVL